MLCARTTLEVELLDAQGRGVPGERVWINRLPELHPHSAIETALDGSGYLKLSGLVPGEYLVRFPQRELPEPDVRTWIAFRLEAGDGRSLAFEPFRVFLPDGEVIEATRDGRGGLQANGTALVPGRPCGVLLPGGQEVFVTLDANGEEVRLDHVFPGEVLILYPEREGCSQGTDPYVGPARRTDA